MEIQKQELLLDHTILNGHIKNRIENILIGVSKFTLSCFR